MPIVIGASPDASLFVLRYSSRLALKLTHIVPNRPVVGIGSSSPVLYFCSAPFVESNVIPASTTDRADAMMSSSFICVMIALHLVVFFVLLLLLPLLQELVYALYF